MLTGAADIEELTSLPEPPKNVRLILEDNTVIPVDCRYLGFHDGKHLWDVIVPNGIVWRPGCRIRSSGISDDSNLRLVVSGVMELG